MEGKFPGVNCGECGRLNEPAARHCQYCGNVLIRRQSVPQRLSTPMPIVGGLLLIASTVLTLWGIVIGLNEDGYFWDYYSLLGFIGLPDWLLLVHGVLAVLGLVGGFSAIMRKHFGLAFVGGLCGAIGLGIGVGVAGLIFIVVSSEEFESRGFMQEPTSAPEMPPVADYYARYGRRV